MNKIVLISCVSKKQKIGSKAENLYISPLFKLSLKYARSIKPDKIFILSAKYGLIDLSKEIEPYELTLRKMSAEKVKSWSEKVIEELKKVSDLQEDEFIFLAGERYRKYLIQSINNYKLPLKGLGIGKQLKFLKENTNERKM